MSQSKTSWTRLFHSPVGFVQDVPYSELLSSWLLASEKYLWLTRRTQTKDDCEVSSITKKKKKNQSEMFHCHFICHMDWDRNNSLTLWFCLCQNSIKGMTVIFEKGWGEVGQFFCCCGNCPFWEKGGQFFLSYK